MLTQTAVYLRSPLEIKLYMYKYSIKECIA